MLNYNEPVYRPPSEANSLIIQATWGCSFNRCTFCAMYKGKDFVARPIDDVKRDIDAAANYWPNPRRVFLADGDAMVLPTDKLVEICQHLTQVFPDLNRISTYAMPGNLLKKSTDELKTLKDNKLKLAYMGIESGNDELLKKIRKGASGKAHAQAINKTIDAGLKLSAMVILGLGGKEYAHDHIADSAKLVSEAPPTFLSTLALRLYHNTVENFMAGFGENFELPDDESMLYEIRGLVNNINCKRPVIFRSNHASNALALAGNLPRDKNRLLAEIDAALATGSGVRPQWMRGL